MNQISRIYKGSELVYSAPDTQPLTAFLTGLVAGDRIELFRAANIRTDAVISTATFKGVNPHGTRGTIVGGPKTGVSNSIWYDINFDAGFDGWCVSDNYTKIASTTTQTTPSYFKVGDRIRLFRASNVRSSAAIATNLKGVNPSGALGTITQGPTKNGTINWYNINFDTGFDGWVASDNYVITTAAGGGTIGGGTTTPGGSVTPVPLGQCNRLVWSPSNEVMCNPANWNYIAQVGGTAYNRVSCGTGPGGGTSVAITEYPGKQLSLMLMHKNRQIPGVSLESAQVQMEMYIPTDFQPTASGRLPLGIHVSGDGQGCGGTGGCLPSDAGDSTIRLQNRISGSSFRLADYSYHLDRTTAPVTGVGGSDPSIKTRVYGQGHAMDAVVPKGEWVTVVMQLTLNTPDQANGSSKVILYNNAGKLLGSAGFTGVTYRTGPGWKITGMIGDHKFNTKDVPTRVQSLYFRNYKMYGCS